MNKIIIKEIARNTLNKNSKKLYNIFMKKIL